MRVVHLTFGVLLLASAAVRTSSAMAVARRAVQDASAVQVTTIRGSEPSCGRCRLRFVRVAVLGRGEERWIADHIPPSVARDSRGRYLVASAGASPLVVYDSTGRHLASPSREGSGPGELRFPLAVAVTPGDSILVADAGTGRISLFGPDLRFVRSAPGPHQVRYLAPLANRSVVINGVSGDRERIGYPLHLVDPAGNHVRSFGSTEPRHDPREPRRSKRLLAIGRHGIWAGWGSFRYRIELWSPDGRQLRVLDRDVDWFRPFEVYRFAAPDRPPPPGLHGIWEDDAGLLWSLVAAPSREWQRFLGPVQRVEGQEVYPILDAQRARDTVVEVVNAETGQLVTSRRFPGSLDLALGGGYVAAYRETEGYRHVEIWRITMPQ